MHEVPPNTGTWVGIMRIVRPSARFTRDEGNDGSRFDNEAVVITVLQRVRAVVSVAGALILAALASGASYRPF